MKRLKIFMSRRPVPHQDPGAGPTTTPTSANVQKTNLVWGFTLIELLVSISIFAIIGVVLYSSFRGGVISWRRINSELALQQKIRYAFNEMVRDFRNMVFLSNLPFKGSADKVKFVTPVKLTPNKGIDIARVSYYLSFDEGGISGGTIIRTEEPIKNALSAEGAELEGAEEGPPKREVIETESQKKEDLLGGVSELKLSYLAVYEESGEEEEEGAEYEWLDYWEEEEALPMGIRIELTLTNPEDSSIITLSKRIFIPMGKHIKKE